MRERGNSAGLALESGAACRIGGDAGRQDFDGDVAAEARIPRAVDLTHTPGPEGRENFVRTKAGAGG
jgi:hypothetical protein